MSLSHNSRRLVTAIRIAAVIMILVGFAAYLLPEQVVWGLWPVTYLPRGVAYALALVALVLALGGEWLWQRWARLRVRRGAYPVHLAARARVDFARGGRALLRLAHPAPALGRC